MKGLYKDKALASVLSLIFAFVSNYAIAVYCCNLLFSRFNYVLYLSLWPLTSLNFLSNSQLMYILLLLISHVYPSQFQSWSYVFPYQWSLT